MDTLVILRQRPTQPGIEALYQHQAILSVARSWLTRRSEEGMVASGSKMIVPCDLDILPLLALVANDYQEIAVSPENSSPEMTSGPIIVYQNGEVMEQSETLMAKFLQPRWFDAQQRFKGLPDLIKHLKPSTCVLIGDATSRLRELELNGYRFERTIGFTAFERQEGAQEFFGFEGEQRLIMADRAFSARLEENLDGERTFSAYRSFWDMANSEESQRPQIEPFVPWGPAFEMNI